MDARLYFFRKDSGLIRPYRLSFGDVTRYESVFVAIEGGASLGLGEITPLPGYGSETVKTVISELEGASKRIAGGAPYMKTALEMSHRAPFTASGLACALETWREGIEKAFETPLDGPVLLSAHCPGAEPEDVKAKAEGLVREGYKVLKLKIGALSKDKDIARIKAASVGAGPDARLRIDANQALAKEAALRLFREIEGLTNLELLEQPFPPEDWSAVEELAAQTTVPIMQDESVHDEADVERAAAVGAKWVKFKLCKHPGMRATLKLINRAKELGLSVVLGNGVQTALGNHLEFRIHRQAFLASASEANGFLKSSGHPFEHRMELRDGLLFDNGLAAVKDGLLGVRPLMSFSIRDRALEADLG